jgi:hypothetical protein
MDGLATASAIEDSRRFASLAQPRRWPEIFHWQAAVQECRIQKSTVSIVIESP